MPQKNQKSFDIDKWSSKILDATDMYRRLKQFIEHEKSLDVFMDSNFGDIDKFEKSLKLPDKFIRKSFDGLLHEKITQAFELYSRQMVVIAATYVEGMLQEFFEVFFGTKPETIHDFLTKDETERGKVNLSELLAHSSKDDLIETLIMRASRNAADGSLRKVSMRIKRLTKYDIKNSIIDDTQVLVNLRNSIVHEDIDKKVSQKEIENYFHTTYEFMQELGHTCISVGLQYEYEWKTPSEGTNSDQENNG